MRGAVHLCIQLIAACVVPAIQTSASQTLNSSAEQPGGLTASAATLPEGWLPLPAEFSEGNSINLQVMIGEKGPYRFVFDTGASVTAIDARLAKELGLQLESRERRVENGEDTERVEYARNVDVQAGPLNANASWMLVVDCGERDGRGEPRVDGYFGYDLLSKSTVRIDYVARSLSVRSALAFKYEGAGSVLPMQSHRFRIPIVHGTLADYEGQPVGLALILDTGACISVGLNRSSALRAGYPSIRQRQTRELRNISLKLQKTDIYRVKGFTLSQFSFAEPAIESFSSEDNSLTGIADGVVGAEILRRFTCIIDPYRQRLILEPNDALAEPVSTHSPKVGIATGVRESDPTKMVVLEVDPDSAASRAGFQIEDVIVAINDIPVPPDSTGNHIIYRQLRKHIDKPVTFVVRRGESVVQLTVIPTDPLAPQ